MSKQLIEKGELVCMRRSYTLGQQLQNIAVVTDVDVTMTNVKVSVQNVGHQSLSFVQDLEVDLHPQWFRVCLPRKKLAKLEIAIVAYILTNPGCTPEQIALNVYTRKGVKDIRSAITRICKKGFTMIRNYLTEV